jgi:tRNA threonylcarbamoyladenosine biosynthesis protein TsaB
MESANLCPGPGGVRASRCVILRGMDYGNSPPLDPMKPGALILSVDTCGPSGSVALGRVAGRALEILGETELAGRTYSATLVSAISGLLAGNGVVLKDLGGIVAVSGPGSFTGVRVGLSAVKGLADGAGIPVVAVSRLLVLSRKAGVPSAALDAHRDEVFLRIEEADQPARELLAGRQELAAIAPPPFRIAVCDDAAAALLASAWPSTQLVRCGAPLASDALLLGELQLSAGNYEDLALLDGNYLRRSDAEIFGEMASVGQKR